MANYIWPERLLIWSSAFIFAHEPRRVPRIFHVSAVRYIPASKKSKKVIRMDAAKCLAIQTGGVCSSFSSAKKEWKGIAFTACISRHKANKGCRAADFMNTNAVNKRLLLPVCSVVAARLRIASFVYSRDTNHSKTKQKDSKAHVLLRLICAINTCDVTAKYTYIVFNEYRIYESKSKCNRQESLRILEITLNIALAFIHMKNIVLMCLGSYIAV